MKSRSFLAVALALCAGATACAPAHDVVEGAASDGLAAILAEARAYGATERQIAVLEQAVEVGEVTYADLKILQEDSFACFEENGIPYWQTGDWFVAPGVPVPGYEHASIPGKTVEETLDVAERCLWENSEFVAMAYQTQPSSIEAADAFVQERLPQAIECLRAQGVAMDDDATAAEVEQASWDRAEEQRAVGVDEVPCAFLLLP